MIEPSVADQNEAGAEMDRILRFIEDFLAAADASGLDAITLTAATSGCLSGLLELVALGERKAYLDLTLAAITARVNCG